MTALDPRAPYVVDIRDLGRRAGAMKEFHRRVPAGAGLGAGLAKVPEGTDVDLDLRLESVVEGVFVSGTARADVVAECARCLEPITWDETADIQELFVYPPQDAHGHVSHVPQDDDEDAPPSIEGDLIDLEATVRDAVVLLLPIAPLCREDCAGLCTECGVRLDEDPGHRHETTDPRWAALSALLDDEKDD